MAEWPLMELEEIVGDTLENIAKHDVIYQTQKKQIKSKFHNKRHKGAKVTTTPSPTKADVPTKKKKKLLFNLKPVRHLCSVQIYSQCYYPTRVRPYVIKALQATAGRMSWGAKLNLSNRITAERLEAEMDSIKGEILAALEELQEELSEGLAKRSPADYLEAIDQAPALLEHFLQEVAEQMGWWFSVIAGGPLPTDNGNIHTQSFHIGKTAQGRDFLDEYTAFSVDPDDPNGQHRTFEESISAPYGHFLKSLFSSEVHAQRALNQAQLDFLDDMATMDQPLASPAAESPSLIPASIVRAIPSPPAAVIASPTAPVIASPIAPVFSSPIAAPFSLFLGSTNTAQSPAALGLSLSTSPTALSPSQGIPLVPHPMDPFPADMVDPALAPYNGLAADLDFFLVGLQQSLPEEGNLPPLPLLPPVYDNNNAQQGSLEDCHLPPLPPLPPMYDNTHTLQGPPEVSHPPPLPPLPPVHDNSDMTSVRGVKRMLERAEDDENNDATNPEVRASKRARKPRIHREVVATGWLPPAVGYLSDITLGVEWQDLLVSWQDLEGRLQVQGCSPEKGHMGALSSRPSVLSHWLVNRRYNVYPHPPANFSNELCRWWNAMQPKWCQNETGALPLPVYDRSLDRTLRKGGPNGIVTVLVGLMWWGQGTLEANERTLWTVMVMDIRMCIQAMVVSLST
ncbi:hypothetical protein EDD18DRAFT_1104419 [Armillaria luteobubalina]|uniref:Uncharacterized protein n=1 Tax=Armillaria luteobubalina TaxID=153913 RepID=A0AA39Q9Q7_9AGAR|nr:hypothetical protein EDD18DRAFT_1104419 [Armillaria luteobubalina]